MSCKLNQGVRSCRAALIRGLMEALRVEPVQHFCARTDSYPVVQKIGHSNQTYRGSRAATNRATKARKTMAMTPFMVKNAAFRRRRSRGETMECS